MNFTNGPRAPPLPKLARPSSYGPDGDGWMGRFTGTDDSAATDGPRVLRHEEWAGWYGTLPRAGAGGGGAGAGGAAGAPAEAAVAFGSGVGPWLPHGF